MRLPGGRPGYRVRVCGVAREVDAGAFRIRVPYRLDELGRADTIIFPGVVDLDASLPGAVVRAVRKAAAAGARVASICSGAFVLAATGLLDGRRATTHWLAAPELARRYPAVVVDPEVLYVDEGQVLTSAGAAAGLDLCLHLVRRDTARPSRPRRRALAVMPLERAGGQAQFIVHEPPAPDGASLEPLLRWLEQNLRTSCSAGGHRSPGGA